MHYDAEWAKCHTFLVHVLFVANIARHQLEMRGVSGFRVIRLCRYARCVQQQERRKSLLVWHWSHPYGFSFLLYRVTFLYELLFFYVVPGFAGDHSGHQRAADT